MVPLAFLLGPSYTASVLENPIILLLEDDPVTAVILERTILVHLPTCRPIWARDLKEARLRTAGVSIDLFVVDVNLPDGSGLDFLWEMATVHPQARALVMSSTPLAEYQAQSAALGALRFLEKPVSPTVLLGFMKEAFASAVVDPTEAFQVSLRHLTPLDVIQLKCLSRATTVMEFASSERVGKLYFRDGNIVHAQLDEHSGIPALQEIFSWKKGSVRELAPEPDSPSTIDCPWQSLLMQVAQAADEAA